MKKIFIISAALLIVVLFFLGIYNFAFKKNTIVSDTNTVVKSTAQPDAAKDAVVQKAPEKIKAISDQAVLGPVFDKKSETITYYSVKDGTVWQTDSAGKTKQQIETTPLEGLKGVLWSPDHQKVLTMFKKGEQVYFYEYDRQGKKGTLLKKGLDTVVWDNLGAKIFYKYYDATTKKRSLNTANFDGSGWQKLSDIDFRDISIAPIPSTSIVSYWNAPDALQESQLQIVGAIGGQPQTIFRGRSGGDYLWSPDGTQALVSSLGSKDNKMTTLGLVTVSGEYHDLNIPTLVSKCAWSSDSKIVYYALPGGIPDGAIMPNDYQNNKFTTDDTFWKVDITTGQKDRVINTEDVSEKYDLSSPFLSAAGDTLYFINKINGKLYRIELQN